MHAGGDHIPQSVQEPLSEGEGEEQGVVVHRRGRVHQQPVTHVAEVAHSLERNNESLELFIS